MLNFSTVGANLSLIKRFFLKKVAAWPPLSNSHLAKSGHAATLTTYVLLRGGRTAHYHSIFKNLYFFL
jgi:hypothetical protein